MPGVAVYFSFTRSKIPVIPVINPFAPDHGTGYLDLYKNADTALYKTKQNGRDGYNIYEEENRE